MDQDHLHRVLHHLKRTLRIEQRLTVEEFYQLSEVSEQIIDYGQMIQAHYGYHVPKVVVEVPELARRFRETERMIEDALLLLKDMGRAKPAVLRGCWIVQLASTFSGAREGFHTATRRSHSRDDDNGDRRAA